MEWKKDLKWNTECDEIETDCSGNQNKMEPYTQADTGTHIPLGSQLEA